MRAAAMKCRMPNQIRRGPNTSQLPSETSAAAAATSIQRRQSRQNRSSSYAPYGTATAFRFTLRRMCLRPESIPRPIWSAYGWLLLLGDNPRKVPVNRLAKYGTMTN
jgi:hypothetical protein